MRHLHHSPLFPLTRRLFRPSPPRLWRRVPWPSLLALLLLTALLSACSSPPALPTVDDSQRRPANSPTAIALQTCQSELHNSRILASERQRSDDMASALAVRQAAQHALQDRLTRIQTTAPAPNTVYVLHFAYGSTRLDWAADQAQRLVAEARDAPLVLLRGRTDGSNNSPADLRLARDRAAAVQAFLVQAGIAPSRIRSTWQPSGDHLVDNDSAVGRDANRRVEIEVYRAAPQLLSVALSTEAP
jgi:outer membrane protein OmpA-like peptidoglycan-associated protein